jgi:hypothetical protein
LDRDIYLYYFDNIVFIKAKNKCHTKILKILNKYQKILSKNNAI